MGGGRGVGPCHRGNRRDSSVPWVYITEVGGYVRTSKTKLKSLFMFTSVTFYQF